jgi:hypothetical protein
MRPSLIAFRGNNMHGNYLRHAKLLCTAAQIVIRNSSVPGRADRAPTDHLALPAIAWRFRATSKVLLNSTISL